MEGKTEESASADIDPGFASTVQRRLPEDSVRYVILQVNAKDKQEKHSIDRLAHFLEVLKDLTRKHLDGYIWQREAFAPHLSRDGRDFASEDDNTNDVIDVPQIVGVTNFGDSIADEWVIVFLLVELSKLCSDAWIRVYDNDGEFLLIEAANELSTAPGMSENMDRRVWINNGHLYWIGVERSTDAKSFTMRQSLDYIQKYGDALRTSEGVEAAAFARIRDYPTSIDTISHHSILTIPRRVAHVLHKYPASISHAVDAFYVRDHISMRPLTTKDIGTLTFPPEDFVSVSVKFTKVGFAQLQSQVFDAPPAWTGIIPKLRDIKVLNGMKLTCGFEMMIADPQMQDTVLVQDIKAVLAAVEKDASTLPSDDAIKTWSSRQDDEGWLDIDYAEFEKELSSKKKGGTASGSDDKDGHNDQTTAAKNLKEVVSRVRDFINDDEAGIDGIDDSNVDSESDSSASEEEFSDIDEVEFENSMKQAMAMQDHEKERSGLLDEARKLALQDDENGSDVDEDEEMRKVMAMMEKELKGHGALDRKAKNTAGSKQNNTSKPIFGPERPPHMQPKATSTTRNKTGIIESDEEFEPGDEELSSDGEDYNDIDLDLAKNMLESFKGQAGLSGPAGNLMRAMGLNMPRDEDHD